MLADDLFLGTKLYHKRYISYFGDLQRYLGITKAACIDVDEKDRVFIVDNDIQWVTKYLDIDILVS
jgi:hypothetical protein